MFQYYLLSGLVIVCDFLLYFWVSGVFKKNESQSKALKLEQKQLSPSIIRHAEERHKFLKEEGVKWPAVSERFDPTVPPSWYDEKRFKNSQYLAKKYFLPLNVSHLMGLLMVLQLPDGLAPLLATGNSKNVPRLFRRYLSTMLHVKNWYETDVFDPQSKGYRSASAVRSMHRRIGEIMNTKFSKKIGQDKIWANQHDMALTQWAFIGLVILYPKQCGLHPATKDELEDMNYFWRVIGHVMGIEDRFNLCDGNYDETYALHKLVLDKDYSPWCSKGGKLDFKDNEEDLLEAHQRVGWNMGRGVMRAMHCFNPTIEFRGFVKYWYGVLGYPHDYIHFTTWTQKWRYHYMRFHFNFLFHFSLFHWYISFIFKRGINYNTRIRDRIEKRLAKRYPNDTYEAPKKNGCPFSAEIQYRDIFGVPITG